MHVFLDYIFLENLLINISVLYQTSIFTKQKVKLMRLILISLLLSISSIIRILEISENVLTNILLLNICIYILFKPHNLIKFIKCIIYFYIIYIIYIGVIISVSVFLKINLDNIIIRVIAYIVSAIISYTINKFMWKIWKNKIKLNNLTYKLIIPEMNNISFKVFVDTGNDIKDLVNKRDVIILNSKSYNKKVNEIITKKGLLEKKVRNKISIEVVTAIGKSRIKGYSFKNVNIEKGGRKKFTLKNVIIIFIDENINNNQYEGILSYNTYLEKLEGVVI